MKFLEAKRNIRKKLESGEIAHENRGRGADKKNYLQIGLVTTSDVIKMLDACTDIRCFSQSPHHDKEKMKGVVVYVFKSFYLGKKWYIKAYLIEPNVFFISVHP